MLLRRGWFIMRGIVFFIFCSRFVCFPLPLFCFRANVYYMGIQSAWENEAELICYGDGQNIVPTIHLDDVCNIIVEVVETTPESRYLLAIDDSKSTLYEITKVCLFFLSFFHTS